MEVELREQVEVYIKSMFFKCLGLKVCEIQGMISANARTVNLTDIIFTKEELKLLDMGLQYNIQQTNKTNWTNLVIETEQAIRLMEPRNQDAYRILATKKLNYNITLTTAAQNIKDKYI